MRTPLIVAALIGVAVSLASPAQARAADPCEGESCGVPTCWEPQVRLRPDMTRAARVSCRNTTGAKLVTPPAHSDITNVSGDWYGLRFDGRPHDDAPRWDEAVFELTGYGGTTARIRVRIEVVPRSENSAPICRGDRIAKRTDGKGPVWLFMHPYCRDPDGDDFVMEGGPPGTHWGSPKHVPAGDSESNWDYLTATHSGDETAPIWATDSLGARSEDAQLEVTVGPGIDKLPYCNPSSYSSAPVIAVNMRPGKIRRFGVICTDPDADLFAALLTSPPSRGALTLVPGVYSYGYWGVEQWQDTTYVPVDTSYDPDPFTVTATGAYGDGPAGRMAMVPRPESYNSGGGCGWSPVDVPSPGVGLLRIGCSDNEGDEFTAKILTPPQHGTTLDPVILPGLHGNNEITIPYVPEPGYEGYDCVDVLISDGHGTTFKIAIDIWVKRVVPDLPVPELPVPELPPVEPELPPVVPEPPAESAPEPPAESSPPDEPESAPSPTPPADHPPPAESTPEPSQPADPPTEPSQPADPPTEPSQPSSPSAPADISEPPPSDASGPSDPSRFANAPLLPPMLDLPHAPPFVETPTFPTASPPPGSAPPPDPGLPIVPTAPAESTRSVAKRILGTKSVKRVGSGGGAEVWARSKLSRRELLTAGQAPGVVVLCSRSCRIRGDARLAIGRKALRSSQRETTAAIASGQPHLLSLALGSFEQRALSRAGKPKAVFSLSIRADGKRPRAVKLAVPIGR